METVVVKASETEAVVRRWRKQRECLHGGYVGNGQWKQRGSVTAAKKAAAVATAEGIGAVVFAVSTVVMALADNSGNGRAGGGGGNRSSGGATIINQNTAAVGGGCGIGGGSGVSGVGGCGSGGSSGSGGGSSKMAGADCSCGCHGHCPIYSRRGACCSTGNQIGNMLLLLLSSC